jgi:transposase
MYNNNKLSFRDQAIFLGLDVHQKNWTVTLRLNRLELKTFSMNPNPDELCRYMTKNYPDGNYLSVYEAGFCGYWIHRKLSQRGFTNIIVNPADVPTTHKEKDQKRDPVDSRKLARELENGSLKGIYIPTEQQQAARSLSRLYFKAVKERTRIKNAIKSFLQFQGVEIPRVDQVSHWSGRFIHWLKGISFVEKENHYYLNSLLDNLQDKRKETLNILRFMRTTSKNNRIIAYLKSISGIGFLTAYSLHSELIDIRRFKNLDHLASFIGLIPSISSSDDKEKQKGLTGRHHKHLRSQLIESAWVAVRHDPALTQSYNQYIQRMPKQKAIVRIAKKLLNRARYVWLNEKEYVTGVVG